MPHTIRCGKLSVRMIVNLISLRAGSRDLKKSIHEIKVRKKMKVRIWYF